jgi:hypothetical protein
VAAAAAAVEAEAVAAAEAAAVAAPAVAVAVAASSLRHAMAATGAVLGVLCFAAIRHELTGFSHGK